jgi:hypothetical protein
MPTQMRAVISRLDDLGIDLTIRNYSRVRADILAEVETWLGVCGLRRSRNANRSLTTSEIGMLNVLAENGVDTSGFADECIRSLPDLIEPTTGPSEETQRRLLVRLAEDIDWIGERADSHGYRTQLLPVFNSSDTLTLNSKHFQLIARRINGADSPIIIRECLKGSRKIARRILSWSNK